MKKVSIGMKPSVTIRPNLADDWVRAHTTNDEPTKRLTIDVPVSLHLRVKSQCALQDLRMADVIREFLDKRFPQAIELGRGGGVDPDSQK